MASKADRKSSATNSDIIIREVYVENFIEETKYMSTFLDKYKFVSFDTEFPGIVFQSVSATRDAYYRSVKTNVDKLKLIQLGITLSDEEGNFPPEVYCWQFNLKFDLNNDQYLNESIALLQNSGINFDLLESKGIPVEMFGEYMISSGLILNDEITWISFHGIYDFAYFLRAVTNLFLPETENQFFDSLKLYFPNYYDIRHLVRLYDNFRCSLNKLGSELKLIRVGIQHQAGSDSLLTSEIFFKLKREFLTEDLLRTDRNVLYGIAAGSEESDSNYQNNYYGNQYKNNNGGYQDYTYPQNMMGMQYGYMRNAPSYFPTSYNFPYNNFNQMNAYQVNNGSTMLINSVTDDSKKFTQ